MIFPKIFAFSLSLSFSSPFTQFDQIHRLHPGTHGMVLQRSQSNASHVLLKAVEPSISGKFSCEVSADAPSFHTELQSSEMQVVGKCSKYVYTNLNTCIKWKISSQWISQLIQIIIIIIECLKIRTQFQL